MMSGVMMLKSLAEGHSASKERAPPFRHSYRNLRLLTC
jgi:hypothetical protein